jgi:predicted PurR-regulated permease PerM
VIEERLNRLTPGRAMAITASVLLVLALAWFLIQIRSILLLLLIGILFGAAIEPMVNRLRGERISRAQAILIIYLVLIALLALVGTFLVPSLVRQGSALINQTPELLDSLRETARGIDNDGARLAVLKGINQAEVAYNRARNDPNIEGRQALAYATSVGGAIVTIVTVLIVAFYWLTEKSLIKRFFLHAIPMEHRDRAHAIWDEIEARMGGWARGQLTLCLIIGVISTIAYAAIGLPFWLALGIWAGITELVPFIGPILGGAAAVAVALTVSFETTLIVLVFVILLQQLEGALLVPRVMRNAVGMTPLTVILAVLIGSTLAGPLGAVLAIPIGASVQAVIQELLRRPADEVAVTAATTDSRASVR